MGKYKSNVIDEVNKSILAIKTEQNNNSKKVPEILDLIVIKFKYHQEFQDKVFSILSEKKLKELTNYLSRTSFDKKSLNWMAYDKQYSFINRNVKRLFKTLDFSYHSTADFYRDFFNAIAFVKKGRYKTLSIDNVPTEFIQKQDNKFILDSGNNSVNISRYEILIYKLLKRKITSNDVFIKDSLEYRHIEDDLIKKEHFKENYIEILYSLDSLPYIAESMEKVLNVKLTYLEETIHRVNKRISANENSHFKIKDKGKWILKYNKIDTLSLNENFFGCLPQTDLADIIHFTDYKTGLLTNFTHLLNDNKIINKELIKAALTAQATNIGLRKMSISSGFSLDKLKNVSLNFIREDTLKLANEQLINETKKVPIFKYFNVSEDSIFSSIDGQKFSTGIDTINARYSSKYFGRDKGISVLTMNAHYLALTAKIISANEFEGHSNLELFLMNESEIQPDYQTSDSHGVNNINFGIFDFFGCSFAPRYTNLNNKCEFLCGTNPPNSYPDNYILKPNYQINTACILEEEFNIKRIIASLALKTGTVSTVIKKINNSPKSNKTRKALVEYDKIIRSIYILNYIDDLSLRQYVQKSLNRQELYHKLKRAICFANGGKMMIRSESGQLIYQECNRLICNMIVYFNSYILSKFLQEKQNKNQITQIEALEQISPISWSHINLYGKYNFSLTSNNTILTEKLNCILGSIDLVG